MSDSDLQPVEFLGPVARCGPGGDSQPQKIRFSDGLVYAVKFPDNPSETFGSRPLAAELMASRVARGARVRTPAFRVVSVGPQFLTSNPSLRFDVSPLRQPSPGRCLASQWVEAARRSAHDRVPTLKHCNGLILARLFAVANLLCLNPRDHDNPYGNLVLDADDRLWVLDWGHPFWFDNGPLSDWTLLCEERYVAYGRPAAKGLLDLAGVATAVRSACRDVASIDARVLTDALEGVPSEWGISRAELDSAAEFLSARRRLLADLTDEWLRSPGANAGRPR
jgi:hypothetical protein